MAWAIDRGMQPGTENTVQVETSLLSWRPRTRRLFQPSFHHFSLAGDSCTLLYKALVRP